MSDTAEVSEVVSALPRVQGEEWREYRAFVLWSLMEEAQQNLSAVARVLRVTPETVKRWSSRFQWQSRRALAGEDASWAAFLRYRRHFVGKYQGRDVVALTREVVTPLGVLASLTSDVLDAEVARHRARLVEQETTTGKRPGRPRKHPAPAASSPVGPTLDRPPTIPPEARIARVQHERSPVAGTSPGKVAVPVNVHEDVVEVVTVDDAAPPVRVTSRLLVHPDAERGVDDAPRVEPPAPRRANVSALRAGVASVAPGERVTPTEVDPDLAARVASAVGVRTATEVRAEARADREAPTPAQAKAQAERDVMLIDAALGFIAREMKEGRVKARISDIPALLRAKALLRGEATERVAVGGVHVVVGAETVRMRDAGDDPTARLAAMREDVRDLSVILDHLESDDTPAVAASLDLPDTAAR